MVYAPIWKDTYYTASTASLAYKIYLGSDLIYSGKAYRYPDGSNLSININKVCQNYLYQDIDTLLSSSSSSSQRNYNAVGDFVLKNSNGTTLETYRFLYDWDYSHSWGGAAVTLSQPINGEFISGQMKLKTTVASSTNNVTTYRSTGDYTKEICGSATLYYVNQRGGWDAFAFPKMEKSETFTPHSYNKSFNNTTYEFETNKYHSEITTSYKLLTGILTDGQSALFAKHLVGSNKCYLHNFEEGWIKPVVITDTSVTYKDSSTMEDIITYQVTVKESQTKQRM